jgi:hypothetical protein
LELTTVSFVESDGDAFGEEIWPPRSCVTFIAEELLTRIGLSCELGNCVVEFCTGIGFTFPKKAKAFGFDE